MLRRALGHCQPFIPGPNRLLSCTSEGPYIGGTRLSHIRWSEERGADPQFAFATSLGVPSLPSGTVVEIIFKRCWPVPEDASSGHSVRACDGARASLERFRGHARRWKQ